MCLRATLEGHGVEAASSPAHQGVWVEMRDLEQGKIQTERNYLYFFFKNENEKAFFFFFKIWKFTEEKMPWYLPILNSEFLRQG